MEEWMHFDRVLSDLFQQPGAYPFPFGSTNLGELYEMSDTDLRRLPLPRLRDQAVCVDMVFAEWKGKYCTLWDVMTRQGMTPYLAEQIARTAHALRRIQTQQRRLRPLLDAAPPPRLPGRN